MFLPKLSSAALITLLLTGTGLTSLGEFPQFFTIPVQAQTTEERKAEADRLFQQGIQQYQTSQFREALQSWEEALNISQEIGYRQGEAASLSSLGVAYSSLGQYQKAIEFHQQSLTIAREIGYRQGEAASLGNLGIAYYSLGQYQKAIEFHQQSLTIARETGNRQGEATSLSSLGVAYSSLGQYHKAIEFHQQHLTIAREIGDRSGEAISLNNLGLTLFKLGQLAAAETTLHQGIDVKESLRETLVDANKVSIFEQQANTYRTLQQVLIAQNQTNEALAIAERGRARAFVELLAQRLANQDNSSPKPIAPPNIDQIKQIAQQQNATLVEYSLIYDEFKIEGKQKWQESELYIWVVKPTGEIAFRRSDLTPLWQNEDTFLAKLVSNTRQSLGVRGLPLRSLNRQAFAIESRPGFKPKKDRLKRLHELLINPIADLLPGDPKQKVIFIPQGSLFLVPFPALQDEEGNYLIEKHTILTSPSIQTLELTREQKNKLGQQSGNKALVVGNPTMPKIQDDPSQPAQQLDPLPGAEEEANTIAPLLDTQALTGNQATKSAILKKMPDAQIIHLATHGLLDDVQGMGSAIALAPDTDFTEEVGKVNGLLTAAEIYNLKLKAELVVLSACDTGRGKITGDGVIGLSRSFISAGVPSILVSLWAVPDAPTGELMVEFYRQIDTNPDKAQALRQAMLATMKTHSQPRDWAAFTLIGEQ